MSTFYSRRIKSRQTSNVNHNIIEVFFLKILYELHPQPSLASERVPNVHISLILFRSPSADHNILSLFNPFMSQGAIANVILHVSLYQRKDEEFQRDKTFIVSWLLSNHLLRRVADEPGQQYPYYRIVLL